jgi:hypothetical protein
MGKPSRDGVQGQAGGDEDGAFRHVSKSASLR